MLILGGMDGVLAGVHHQHSKEKTDGEYEVQDGTALIYSQRTEGVGWDGEGVKGGKTVTVWVRFIPPVQDSVEH